MFSGQTAGGVATPLTTLPEMRHSHQTSLTVVTLNLFARLRVVPARMRVILRQAVDLITAQTLGHAVDEAGFVQFGANAVLRLMVGVHTAVLAW